MKRSRVRVGFTVLFILIACGVGGLELMERFEPELSAEVQVRRLDSFWASRRGGRRRHWPGFPVRPTEWSRHWSRLWAIPMGRFGSMRWRP